MREFLKIKELLLSLALQHTKVRYKTAALGFLWMFLNPLIMMVVLYGIFSRVINIKVPNYPLFLLSGLLPWMFISHSVVLATNSIVDSAPLLTKVAIPREIVPISVIVSNLIGFLASLFVLLLTIPVFGLKVTPWLLFIPLLVVLSLMLASGISLATSALNAYFLDVRYLVDAALLIWFYASPIFYTVDMVPKGLLPIFRLNPAVGLIVGFQNVCVKGERPDFALLSISLIGSALLLGIGWLTFNRLKGDFADVI